MHNKHSIDNRLLDDQSLDDQFISRNGTFAFSEQSLEDVLDYLEDMILMTGCSTCGSLQTRMAIIDNTRLLICLNCGMAEELPPPN